MLRNGLLVLIAFSALSSATERNVITSTPVTDWGTWGNWDRCPDGTLARAFQIKHESGTLLDWTAMNAVRLHCGDPLDSNTKTVTSAEGAWGSWRTLFRCPSDKALSGFQMRVERPGLISDETATNNIRFFCTGYNDETYIEADGGSDGRWGDIVRCPPNEAICSIKSQVQPDSGTLVDDTSLNNLSFECCAFP